MSIGRMKDEGCVYTHVITKHSRECHGPHGVVRDPHPPHRRISRRSSGSNNVAANSRVHPHIRRSIHHHHHHSVVVYLV